MLEQYLPTLPKFVAFAVLGAPTRTFSQTNIHQYSNTLRNQWSSGEWS